MGRAEVVGRDAELQRVVTHLRAATDGPQALVIEGEAGAGKTAVWDAALDGVEGTATVLACRSVSSEMDLPYAALGDLLRGVLEPTLDELPVPQRPALQVALRLDDAEDGSTDHGAVAAAVLSVVVACARREPVLLAVDDLQWLDRPSARALGYAFRRLTTESVRVLATL